MSVRRNVVANYLGQGWRALMGIAFVPLYIKYLGIEAYGLIGVFAIVQSLLGLVDSGMRPILIREMARFSAGAQSSQSVRDLLRSFEIIAFGVAVLIVISTWAVSGWLAHAWLTATTIPVGVVAHALTLMGAVTALRLLESVYVCCVAGLQRQVQENAVTAIAATIRGLGAVGVLAWVSPTIEAFFIWQGVVSVATVTAFSVVTYKALPVGDRAARFSSSALLSVRKLAAGTLMLAALSLALMQVDKILLSKLLTLEQFGYYALASAVANSLFMLASPVSSALYPRFSQLIVEDRMPTLVRSYHAASQLVVVLVGSAGAMLAFFGDRILLLWVGDAAVVQQVYPLMAVLAVGVTANGILWIPYQLQLAYGWTGLATRVNVLAVVIVIPAVCLVVPSYGGFGAALVWVVLNAAYLVVVISLMHKRLLPGEKWRWYLHDVAVPLAAIGACAIAARLLLAGSGGLVREVVTLMSGLAVVTLSGLLAASSLRARVLGALRRREG